MSKQSDNKAAQGYEDKPLSRTCGNCAHFTSDMVLSDWCVKVNAQDVALGRSETYGDDNKREKNLRCDFGGFAVKKMATCNEFALAPVQGGAV